jgi:class 3 adenylate cyclase/tetratricopeptide (TPR) repeat protein
LFPGAAKKSAPPTSNVQGKTQVLTIHLGKGQIHSSIFNPDRTLRQVIEKLCDHRSDLDQERSVATDSDGNVLDLGALMGDLGIMDMNYGVPEVVTNEVAEDELRLEVIAATHSLGSVHIDLIDEFMQSGQLMNGDVLESKTEHDSEFTRRKLKDMADKMKAAPGLIAKTRRLRLRNYENCMVASEIVHWTMTHMNVPRNVAITIGRGLQREGFINHVTFRYNFDDSKDLLFRFSDEVDAGGDSSSSSSPSSSSSNISASTSGNPPLSPNLSHGNSGSASDFSSPTPHHITPAPLLPQTSRMLPKKMAEDVRYQARAHSVFWNPAGGRVTEAKKRKSFKRVILLKTLSSYVPNVVLREFVANPSSLKLPFINHFPACVLFADISGFTPLCEACAKQGSRGVEVLTSHLNEYFGRMINLILNHGGDIVKFAGDALVAIFPTSDMRGLGYSCLLASQCALAMQEHLHQYDADGCLLTLHIGIGAGEIAGIVVGGVANRMEFLIAGQPMDQVAACEAAAKSGEVFISYEAASLIKPHIEISIDQTSKKGTKKKKIDLNTIPPQQTMNNSEPLIFRLDKVPEPIALPPSISLPHFKSMKSLITPFVQPAVLGHLNSGSPDHFLAELRNVSVIFVSLGLKYSSDVIDKLQQCVTAMQECVQFYEGTIRQFIIDDKGSVLIAAFGLPPLSHEDDPCRAVQAAMMLQKRVADLSISTNVGVTTGKAFCGAVGSEERREYAMVGDIVNLSARLMSKADGGILCDRDTFLASKSRINFKTLTPITVKGKIAPIDIFAPLQRGDSSTARDLSIALPAVSLQRPSGDRSNGTRRELLRNVKDNRFLTSRSMNSRLVGRQGILEQLRALLAWLNDPFTKDENARFVLVEGDAGIGKSFVLGHFVKMVQKNREAVRPLLGSTFSIESTTPYFAWKDILNSILELDGIDKEARAKHVTDMLRDRLNANGASELIDYIPLLKSVVSVDFDHETDSCRELTGQPRADKLEQLLVKLLETSKCPLVILDNSQWLDSASWRLVLAAAQNVKHMAFVLSARPIDQPPLELEKLLALDKSMQIQMTPFGKEETMEIVAQKLGVKSIPTNVGEIIADKGSGNPLLLCELADALLATGQIEITPTGECRGTSKLTKQLSSVGIPNTLRGLITGKVDRLPQNQQMILKAASVIGRTFASDLLRQICQAILNVVYPDEASFMNDINSLEAMDLISLKSEDPPTYMFQQIMTQEVIYDLMLFAQRKTIHESIARYFEANMSAEDATFPLLAHHYRKANVLDKAIQYYAKSGEQAMANYANREAVAFFNDAIELQTTSVMSSEPTPPSSAKNNASISQNTWFILSWKRQLGQAYYNLGLFEKAGSVLESALVLINEPVRIKVGVELLSKLKVKQTKMMDPQMFKMSRASTSGILSTTGLFASTTTTSSASSSPSSSHGVASVLAGSNESLKGSTGSIGSGNGSPSSSTSGSPSTASLKVKGRATSVASMVSPQILAREHILVLLTLGRVNYYACNIKVMTYCNLMALKKAEELGVSRELCEAYGGSILTCSIHMKYDLAEAYFETGFSMASFFSGSDSEPLMNLLQATGMYYTGVQQWQNAEKNFKKVIEIAKVVGNSRRFEESTIFLSVSLFLQGKIKDAQRLTEEAVISAKRRGDAQSQILAFSAQARNLLALGQSVKAHECLDIIEHLVMKTEGYKLDMASEINFHSLMSLYYLSQKDFELAYKTAETIVKLLDESDPTCFFTFPGYMTCPEVFCIVLQEHHKLGSSFKLKGNQTPAIVMAKIDKSLGHLQNFAKSFTFAEPRLDLWRGVVEQLTSKNDKAHSTWKKSLGLAQKYGMLYDQGIALFRIGKLMDVKDKREVVEEKLAAYDAAIDIFTGIGAVYTELLME